MKKHKFPQKSPKERADVGEVAEFKQEFKEQKSAYQHGPKRTKNQQLTNKITRGARFGKVWYPYTKFPF